MQSFIDSYAEIGERAELLHSHAIRWQAALEDAVSPCMDAASQTAPLERRNACCQCGDGSAVGGLPSAVAAEAAITPPGSMKTDSPDIKVLLTAPRKCNLTQC